MGLEPFIRVEAKNKNLKSNILSLKLSEEPIYALGIHFSYNDELATKRNFYDKLGKLSTFGHQETFLFMAKLI